MLVLESRLGGAQRALALLIAVDPIDTGLFDPIIRDTILYRLLNDNVPYTILRYERAFACWKPFGPGFFLEPGI